MSDEARLIAMQKMVALSTLIRVGYIVKVDKGWKYDFVNWPEATIKKMAEEYQFLHKQLFE